jgi:hypothetical protein
VPANLDLARGEFERWRRSRPRGERIPAALWRTATDLARSHGVSKTSQALHLDYYAVQRRLLEAEAKQSAAAAEFIEVSLPSSPHVPRCQVEIRDASGGAMRIDLSGLSARDLATFVRTVSGRER